MRVFRFRVTQAERYNDLGAESFRLRFNARIWSLVRPPLVQVVVDFSSYAQASKPQELTIEAKRYRLKRKIEGQKYALLFMPLNNRFQKRLEKFDQSLLLQRILR